MEAPIQERKRPQLTEHRPLLREVIETLLLIIGIYTLVNLATARFKVEGQSMFPTFEGAEFLIVSRLDYMIGEPQRGDIVVFHYPDDPQRDFIKRVIGLPGETITIDNGKVFINGVPIDEPYVAALCSQGGCSSVQRTLGDDEYFVLGDNRGQSKDSTNFGPIKRHHIIGRAWIKYWPPEEWGIINHHTYENGDLIPATAPPTPLPTPTFTPEVPLGNTQS